MFQSKFFLFCQNLENILHGKSIVRNTQTNSIRIRILNMHLNAALEYELLFNFKNRAQIFNSIFLFICVTYFSVKVNDFKRIFKLNYSKKKNNNNIKRIVLSSVMLDALPLSNNCSNTFLE